MTTIEALARECADEWEQTSAVLADGLAALIERRLTAFLRPEGSGTCAWADEDGFWSTDCGHEFSIIDGTPAENGMLYCCYCGGAIPPAHEPGRDAVGASDG